MIKDNLKKNRLNANNDAEAIDYKFNLYMNLEWFLQTVIISLVN